MDKVVLKAELPPEVKVAEQVLREDKSSDRHARQYARSILDKMRSLKLDVALPVQSFAKRLAAGDMKSTKKLANAIAEAGKAYADFLTAAKAEQPEMRALEWEEVDARKTTFDKRVVALVPGLCLMTDVHGENRCDFERSLRSREDDEEDADSEPKPATWPKERPEFCSEACAARYAMLHLDPPEPDEKQMNRARSEGALWAIGKLNFAESYSHVAKAEYDGDISIDGLDEDELDPSIDEYLTKVSQATENALLDEGTEDDPCIAAVRDHERIPCIDNREDAAEFIRTRLRLV
jgi:hypothetical protein